MLPPRQRAEARKEEMAVTPSQRQRQKPPVRASGLLVQGNKGVLRTIGSKLIFAYFCSATKVGHRRLNTKRYTIGQDRTKHHRQKNKNKE